MPSCWLVLRRLALGPCVCSVSCGSDEPLLTSLEVPMVLRSFYSPHERVTLDCGNLLITKQSSAAECDINNIISQFSRTGIISHINSSTANFTDLPDAIDFQQSLALVASASEAFATLPSKVRDRYNNDPGSFLLALSDPSERAFLTDVGVFKPPVVPAAQPGSVSAGGAPGAPASPASATGAPG